MSEWRRNDSAGFSLVDDVTYTPKILGLKRPRQTIRTGVADVFKAAKGNRWIVRILRNPSRPLTGGYDQYTALTLRDAMRMAKFLVAVNRMEDDDA